MEMKREKIVIFKGMIFSDSKMHKVLAALNESKIRQDAEDLLKFTMVGGAVLDTVLGLEVNDYDVYVEEFFFAEFSIEDMLRKEGTKFSSSINPYRNISKVIDLDGAPVQLLSELSEYPGYHYSGFHKRGESVCPYELINKNKDNPNLSSLDFKENKEESFRKLVHQVNGLCDVETFVANKFDIAIKTLTYSIEHGLQWDEEFEIAYKTKDFLNETYVFSGDYFYRDEDREAERMEKAIEKYSEPLENLIISTPVENNSKTILTERCYGPQPGADTDGDKLYF